MEGCYWIAIPGGMARTNCNKEMLYLNKSIKLPEEEMLTPYIGEKCPCCGNDIYIDEHSYDLVKKTQPIVEQ